MGSDAEDLRFKLDTRKKLGAAYVHANLEKIIDDAHDIRERDYTPFDEALNIAAGKTRTPYGTRKP